MISALNFSSSLCEMIKKQLQREGRKQLDLTLGGTDYVYLWRGGIFVTHMCRCPNAHRGRWDVASSRGGNDFQSPQGKLGSVVLQEETISLFMETGSHNVH